MDGLVGPKFRLAKGVKPQDIRRCLPRPSQSESCAS